MEYKWYIIHTMSGYENRVAKQIEEHARKDGLASCFEKIVIPTEEILEVRRGKKVNRERKFLPGYVLVRMFMNDMTWHLVKNIPKVTGFLGGIKDRPAPITEEEVNRIFKQMEEGSKQSVSTVEFEIGEAVKVIDGPFDSFVGVVVDVDSEKARLKVSVSIFGRSTPVDLEYAQVERV